MKILLPFHLGCGNRGCEGIARGISNLLDLPKNQLILFDISPYDYNADLKMELNQIGKLCYTKQNRSTEFARLIGRAFQKVNINFIYNEVMSKYFLSYANAGDAIFITGGDIYCYDGAAVLPNLIVKEAKSKHIKTVLFGASIEEKYLTPKVVAGLRKYDLIITRESISSNILSRYGLPNKLYPDPAFSLKPTKCDIPEYFKSNVVGINFSPFTDRSELFEKNMDNLIEYILSNNMEVCFIPHVFWKEQDDRESINKYVKKFGSQIHCIDTEKLSYLQIRYIISKCAYFIGGRTHSVISAYSTHVPCLALGYSVKAKGIAKDIKMPEYTVVDSNNIDNDSVLLNAFRNLQNDRNLIMNVYDNLDEYLSTLSDLKNVINEVLLKQ